MRFEDMRNARVAILGTGREGQSVWRRFRRLFPEKPLALFAEFDPDVEFSEKLDLSIDRCHVGPLEFSKLKSYDILVRSAGISPYRTELARLRSAGIRFTSASSLWFAENPGAKTVCISGTMGKSTTASLTSHLLRWSGVNTCLAGNIGRPMLDCDGMDINWWVIELSSYQISDLEADPDIVVLLNLSDEHIDWHGSPERYAADKLRLADLAAHGRVIANYADDLLVEGLSHIPGVHWFNRKGSWQARRQSVIGESGVPVSAAASLPGQHNMQNLAAALSVLDELGVDIHDLDRALAAFTGLPHRLEMIGEKNGIRYVNDSISTTPVSVAAALQTVGYRDTVLLLGGMDRGLDWGDFAVELANHTPYAVITLPDNGPEIFACLKHAGVRPEAGLHQSAKLIHAVELARGLAREGGCILLSPGAPSFPHFRDFEDRGNQFKNYAGIEKHVSSAHKKRPRDRG